MAESIMGIEIGSSTIKLIEITKRAATLTVQKFSLLDTPRDCISNGMISNPEPIRQLISEEIQNKKYRAKKTVAVVQSNSIIIRNAVMEKQPEKIIKQLLELKTEEYLPIEREHYQIDFRITREIKDDKGEKNELLLVAVPNSVILPIANMIRNLKRIPVLISTPSEALGNVFGVNTRMIYDSSIGGVLVLDIGSKSTSATIIANDQAVLTRTIDFGVDSISQTLSQSLEEPVNEEEAKEEYENYLSEMIKPQIEYSIISEVERILQFYYSNFENTPIKKIYLIGGGANIRGVRTYIRDAFNMPTEKLSEFSTVIERPGIEFEPYRRFFVNILGAINGL